MVNSLKTSFIFFLSILSLCSFVLSQTFDCDPKNRPKESDCEKGPFEDTCGYYTKDCPLEVCGENNINACGACNSPNVLYYEKKECDLDLIVEHCPNTICDTKPKRYADYEPVCGLRKDEEGNTIEKTFENACLVCKSGDFSSYQPKPCKKDRVSCDSSSGEEDNFSEETEDSPPVCAYFSTLATGDAFTTVSSGSEACSDKAVEFWTKGACGAMRDNTIFCLPNSRPEACFVDVEEPVCGFYQGDRGGEDHKIMESACFACGDPLILFYIPGPCVFYCDLGDFFPECDSSFELVCGTYEENGEKKKVSLRNPCIACSLTDLKIVSYTDGLCPGDEKIRCENDPGGYEEEALRPVCAYSAENCNDDSCRRTLASPRVACKDPKIISYIPGVCPGDEGVPCDNYRTRSTDPQEVYAEICGVYSSENCPPSSSCLEPYEDQYVACANSKIDYFTFSPC